MTSFSQFPSFLTGLEPAPLQNSTPDASHGATSMSFVNSSGADQNNSNFPPPLIPEAVCKKSPKSSKKRHKKKKRKRKCTVDPQEVVIMSKLKAVKQVNTKMMQLQLCDDFSAGNEHFGTGYEKNSGNHGKSQNKKLPSRWDVSALTLLNMTLTFLRHVPEVCIIFLS